MEWGIFLSWLLEFDRKDGKSNLSIHEFPKISSWENWCVLSLKGKSEASWGHSRRALSQSPSRIQDSTEIFAHHSHHPWTNRQTTHTVLHKTKDLSAGLAGFFSFHLLLCWWRSTSEKRFTPAHIWSSTFSFFCSISNIPLGMILAKKGHDPMQYEKWRGRVGSLLRWTCKQFNLPQRLICQAKQTLPSAAERFVDLWALRGNPTSSHNLQRWMSYKSTFPEVL